MFKPWKSGSNNSLQRTFEKTIDKYGHFVLYRRYNVGEKSPYYEENTGSSDGGPKWTYRDEVARVRHDPMSVRGAVGTSIQVSKMYIKAARKPKRGDVIIEVDYKSDEPYEAELYAANHTEAFEIVEIDQKRYLLGKVAYYIVQVSPMMKEY